MRRILLALLTASCTHPPAPPSAKPAASTPVVVASAPLALAPAPAPTGCVAPSEVDTIDDGNGVPGATGSMALGDVQILADTDKIAVTWTREAQYQTGDSWRTPLLGRKASRAATWDHVALPVLSFACATYGTAAVNTLEHPFIAWGVANNRGFEVFDKVPGLSDSGTPWLPNHSKPVANIATPKQSVSAVVASRDVSAAVLNENLCEMACTCGDAHERRAVWLRSLDRSRPWAQRVTPIYEWEDKLGAPALSVGDRGGVVAYRVKSALHLAWLDAEGKLLPDRKPVLFDSGDVGAPAVAMAGSDAIVVWARRASKSDPYELQSMRLAHGDAPTTPVAIKTTASAFAPALVADEKSVTLAWMEGDGGFHGEVRMARGLSGPGVVVSGDESNARDPELSGTPESPVIVWQSFPENRRAGVLRVARVDCSR